MTVRLAPRQEEPPIPEEPVFTLVAPDGRRLTASTRPIGDGLALRCAGR